MRSMWPGDFCEVEVAMIEGPAGEFPRAVCLLLDPQGNHNGQPGCQDNANRPLKPARHLFA